MNKIITGLWAASIGVAFYAGTLNSSPSLNVIQNEVIGSNSGKTDKSLVSKQNKAQKQLRISISRKGSRSTSYVVSEFQSLAKNPMTANTYSDEYLELFNFVKDLSEEELAEALSQIDLESIDKPTSSSVLLLLRKYAEYNPQNALELCESNISLQKLRIPALSTIGFRWSKSDPESAYDWFKENSDDSSNKGTAYLTSYGWSYIFRSLAENDLPFAIEKLKEIDGKGYNTNLYASNAISNSLKTKEDFIYFFENVKDLENKQKIEENALTEWVRKDPNETVSWLNTLEKDNRKKYEEEVFKEWRLSDPLNAANWYFEVSENKQKATYTAVTHWALSNPQDALKWVENQKGINTQKTVTEVIKRAVYDHPDFVIKNLYKLPDEKSREKISERVYFYLKRKKNNTKASEFLESSPYKEYIEKRNSKK